MLGPDILLRTASSSGEAYDKIARLLGLDMQPNGGACLEALARRGDPTRFPFKTPMQKQVIGGFKICLYMHKLSSFVRACREACATIVWRHVSMI